MDVCTIPDILKILKFLLILIDIIKFLVPMGLIVMGSIDLSKSVISKDESEMKKNWNLFFKRIIYSVVIFLLPTIVNFVIVFLGDLTSDINLSVCIANIENIDYYENLAEEKEKKEKEEYQKRLEAQRLNANENASINSSKKSGGSSEGTGLGQKYNLTKKQLRGIARLCQKEQDSPKGAAAEASLMANKFEISGGKHKGKTYNDLYTYVRDTGWWSSSDDYMEKEDFLKQLKPEILTAVEDVLVRGNRTLPYYVDEHDCVRWWSTDEKKWVWDIKEITNGNEVISGEELLDRSNYKQNKTKITNRYKSDYTFYIFPDEFSDPFGYTDDAIDKYNKLNKG